MIILLWELDSFRSDVVLRINQRIIEYDMKSANISLARVFHLLPEKEINRIASLGKKERVIAVGKIKQKDPTYNAREKRAFADARRAFFEINNISNNDVVAIKRDAIFLTKYVKHETLFEYINFRKKQEYSSYIYLSPLELYYDQKGGLDVKGISDDVYKSDHKDYFGEFLSSIFKALEVGGKFEATKRAIRFFDRYKWGQLSKEYYREFNPMSCYAYQDGTKSKEEYMEDMDSLDISYNFKLLLNVIQILTM